MNEEYLYCHLRLSLLCILTCVTNDDVFEQVGVGHLGVGI